MKVIHMESGLGNQMLSYCELLAARKMNPMDKYYIETIIYGIQECHQRVCQWNGYELERIFNIRESNFKELFNEEDWKNIQKEVVASRFWEKNWNYPVYFTEIFSKYGIDLINGRGNFEDPDFVKKCSSDYYEWKNRLKGTNLYRLLKKVFYIWNKKEISQNLSEQDILFQVSDGNLFMGQRLSFKFKGTGIEKIDSEIRNVFRFPELTDKKDIQLLSEIQKENSVAIHARRGDMLSANGYCYKNGYFRSAVKHIKKNIENPVFLFFCDPGSIVWCEENPNIFGLDMRKDRVLFVDWHDGDESYRDMQLMAQCKHNIITNSSFGWWGSYLNNNPEKITISPDCTINTTCWF